MCICDAHMSESTRIYCQILRKRRARTHSARLLTGAASAAQSRAGPSPPPAPPPVPSRARRASETVEGAAETHCRNGRYSAHIGCAHYATLLALQLGASWGGPRRRLLAHAANSRPRAHKKLRSDRQRARGDERGLLAQPLELLAHLRSAASRQRAFVAGVWLSEGCCVVAQQPPRTWRGHSPAAVAAASPPSPRPAPAARPRRRIRSALRRPVLRAGALRGASHRGLLRGARRGEPRDLEPALRALLLLQQRRVPPLVLLHHCPGREPAFLAAKRPARPCNSAMQNRLTVGNAEGA